MRVSFAGGDALVQLVKDRLDRLAEFVAPIQRAALGGGGAVGIHPVHAVLAHQADQALGQLLDRLVEGFAGRMAVLAQHVVLGFHDARQRAHQHAALAGQVAVDFVLEGGREQIARADGNAQRQGAFGGAPV